MSEEIQAISHLEKVIEKCLGGGGSGSGSGSSLPTYKYYYISELESGWTWTELGKETIDATEYTRYRLEFNKTINYFKYMSGGNRILEITYKDGETITIDDLYLLGDLEMPNVNISKIEILLSEYDTLEDRLRYVIGVEQQ